VRVQVSTEVHSNGHARCNKLVEINVVGMSRFTTLQAIFIYLCMSSSLYKPAANLNHILQHRAWAEGVTWCVAALSSRQFVQIA
jgi:hypothetical protein